MFFIEKDIWLKYKNNFEFVLIGIDCDEFFDKVIVFGKLVGVMYLLGLDLGVDIFVKYVLCELGIIWNVLIDWEGKIVKLICLYNEEEFVLLVD